MLKRLSDLAPSDSETAYGAANLMMQARQFIPAAEYYSRARRADPQWPELHNEAAFGFAFAGDIKEALESVEAYRKLEPRSANPDDTQGEILFTARRFAEAERSFLAAFDKNPAFFAGAPLRKAAEARRAAGNQAEADRLFARYVEVNAKRPLIELEKAQWDYTSGRQQEAASRLEAFAAKTNASAAWSQLAAWRAVNGGDAVGAAALARKTAKSPAEQQVAAIAQFATQPDTTAAEWQSRAAAQFPPGAAAFARQALCYALALRKHWADAIPVITAQRDSLPPAQASYWRALLAVALHESGQAGKAKLETRLAPIPRTVGDATWDFLVYPKIWKIT
jgi:Tfp pilus assembly protein PilF